MKRQLLIAFLVTSALWSASRANAQTFIPQTKPIPGVTDYTHVDAMKILGSPRRGSGDLVLPRHDTVGTQTRWDTIFDRGNYNVPNRRYQLQGWNRQPTYYNYGYNYPYNSAQLQQSAQQFSNAMQQFRQRQMTRNQPFRSQRPRYRFNRFARWR